MGTMVITAITDEELIAKFTDGTTEKFSWEYVQRMEECFTTVEDQKRVALNVIYEIDNKESINKNNKNLLDWKQIQKQKKVNMYYKKKNKEKKKKKKKKRRPHTQQKKTKKT